MRFAKGHGTGNDFLILPDPDGVLELSAELVAGLCDRRTGLGADGVLRAVRTAAVAGPAPAIAPTPGTTSVPAATSAPAVSTAAAATPAPAATPALPAAEWFMDYRNADGSVAEMCGNGIRVFARYLLERGLAGGSRFAVATRSGPRLVWAEPGGAITVDMGAPVVSGRSAAVIGGIRYQGLEVSLGNPHLACLVDRPVADIDLTVRPEIDRERFPDGANVELVRACGGGQLEMRVYERGSGVTLSCGTGAVAAAVAAAVAVGEPVAGEPEAAAWTVDVPGGTLTVTLCEKTSLLTGPAVIVAEGDLCDDWLPGRIGAGSRIP
jgi:diaminopimelate epimerase